MHSHRAMLVMMLGFLLLLTVLVLIIVRKIYSVSPSTASGAKYKLMN